MYIALKQNNLMADGQYVPNQSAACPYFFATALLQPKTHKQLSVNI